MNFKVLDDFLEHRSKELSTKKYKSTSWYIHLLYCYICIKISTGFHSLNCLTSLLLSVAAGARRNSSSI